LSRNPQGTTNNHESAHHRIHLNTNAQRRVELSRMKKSFVILLSAILCLSACAPAYYYGRPMVQHRRRAMWWQSVTSRITPTAPITPMAEPVTFG
jgi:hypothetical protein